MQSSQWSLSKAALSLVLAGSILLSGCASTGSTMLDSSAPAADPRLTQGNDASFFSKSGFQACAVGAGVAALACMAASNNKAQCAIVAGIAVCGVAMGANYYLDVRRSQYQNTSERLSAMSRDIQADTEKVTMRTATAQQVIRDDQQRLARIKQDLARKQLDKAKAEQEIASIDQNIAVLRKDLENMRNKVSEYERVAQQERAQGNTAQIDQEILKMNQKVVALQQEVDGLYNQRSAITLG